MRYLFNSFLAGILLLFVSQVAVASTWNAASDFSANNNANGVWSYGYIQRVAQGNNYVPVFTALTNTTTLSGVNYWGSPEITASIGYNGTSTTQNPYLAIDSNATFIPANTVVLHPSLYSNAADLRFTSPSIGAFNVTASFFVLNQYAPQDTSVQIIQNTVGPTLLNDLLYMPMYSSSFNTVTYSGQVNLNQSDSLDFIVNNPIPINDSIGVSVSVSAIPPVPEPGEWLLMIIGLLLVFIVVGRRKGTVVEYAAI